MIYSDTYKTSNIYITIVAVKIDYTLK